MVFHIKTKVARLGTLHESEQGGWDSKPFHDDL